MEKAEDCRREALRLRERAAGMLNPEGRRIVIQLAESYERLASYLEKYGSAF